MNFQPRATNGQSGWPVTSVTILAAAGALLLVTGCAAPVDAPSEPTAEPPAVTLPISYNEVMVAAVDHAAHELWNAVLDENLPQNDEDWTELEHHAVQLVTAAQRSFFPEQGLGTQFGLKVRTGHAFPASSGTFR